MTISFRTCFLVLLAAGCGARLAATGGPATMGPDGHLLEPDAAASGPANVLIREGIALHDKGDFDGAIAKYREALKAQPGNDEAWFEMAYSLYEKKDLNAALAAAESGVKLNGRSIAVLEMMIGNFQDDLGAPEKSIAAYQASIRENPKIAMVHFNLGITLFRMERNEEARRALQASARLDPNHPGSQLQLGRLYLRTGYKLPALLALSRFLLLEPHSPRSPQALAWIDALFKSGVKKGEKKNNIEILFNPDAPKDEGNYSAAALLLALQGAADLSEDSAKKTETQRLTDRLTSMLSISAELSADGKTSGFASEYYDPYFAELKKNKQLEIFSHYVYQGAALPENAEWLAKHDDEVKAMLRHSGQFKWNREAMSNGMSAPAPASVPKSTPASAPEPVPAASSAPAKPPQ